ncbi:ATP-dependent dethiobiotin synthetase BioD [Haemophilus influenzae]|nr:ATP-dependent dethiobiotin synthetase BioD [Haemophilus influenzae]PRK97721.1 ATP-dependent dethiobiotin synthetase BioD [Haemophilus influenzae]
MSSFFVAGTDTNVGKTTVARNDSSLARAGRASCRL